MSFDRACRFGALALGLAAAAFGQPSAAAAAAPRTRCAPAPYSPYVGEQTTQISPHVWVVMGFPNIGIVVGTTGVLVVDTGLGPKNGATVAKIAAGLAPGRKLYLTTTHFHPEHASGDAGFPQSTVLIRNAAQQKEMEDQGAQFVEMFAQRSEEQKSLLSDVQPRRPDILFDTEHTLDLGGGVNVRLLWFGAAHTKGDELIFVEPDKTLISGDVVQNKISPNIPGEGGSAASWAIVLDKVQALGAEHVVPDHTAPGDGSLIVQEKAFITDLRTRARDHKRRGDPIFRRASRSRPSFARNTLTGRSAPSQTSSGGCTRNSPKRNAAKGIPASAARPAKIAT